MISRLISTFLFFALLSSCAPQTPAPRAAEKQISQNQDLNPVLKKLTTASGDKATINDVMEKLIGEWHADQSNYTEETLAWMKENNVGGYYNTFRWGTNKAWIDFGDFQIVSGQPKKTGVGMMSWHTGFKHLRFRESGARGGFVDGMIEIVDENTFRRHYEFFSPKGDVSYRSDTWSFDSENPNCFIWQSTRYYNNQPKAFPGQKYCKK